MTIKENLSEFKKLYQNKWIAKDTKTGKIIAAAKRLKSTVEKASKITKNYSVENVLPPDQVFIPIVK